MIVCICKNVSDKVIEQHLAEGESFDEIQFNLGVGLQCGCCESFAREICTLKDPVKKHVE